jgi:hypothetical protein
MGITGITEFYDTVIPKKSKINFVSNEHDTPNCLAEWKLERRGKDQTGKTPITSQRTHVEQGRPSDEPIKIKTFSISNLLYCNYR